MNRNSLPGRAVVAAAMIGSAMSFTGTASTASTASTPASASAANEVVADGAWSWFGDPRAVYHQGAHRRTYVGWVDARGNIRVESHDHGTGQRAVGTLATGFQIDDHNNPSILVRPDGRLIVFWSGHAGSTMYYRRSARPEDVTAWETTRTVPTNVGTGYTYPNPVPLSSEGNKIYLFWRGGNSNPTLSTSSDEVSWSRARTVISMPGQRPYVKYHGNGRDTIAMAFTEAHPRNLRTSIYFAAYRAGAFYRADGTRIATTGELPFTPAEADKVYDAAATGAKAWVHDVALDPSGRPVIVYAVFPSDGDHRYRFARWDGRAWQDHEITRAGGSISEDPSEPNYSGGITLDHEDPSTVYMSRQVGGVFEIETWRTGNGGTSWSRTPVTSSSIRDNYRPVSPRGQTGGQLDVIWMHGRYPSYTRFQTGLCASPAVAGRPVCSSDRLDVFARGGQNQLVHRWFDRAGGGWSDWEHLGGVLTSEPTAVSWGPHRIDVFARGGENQLVHRWYDRGAGWSKWEHLGGALTSAPEVASWSGGRLDVFARGTRNQLLHRWYDRNKGWSTWEDLGGALTSAPTAVSWSWDRLDVFARGSNDQLLHRSFDRSGGGWSGWEDLGGTLTSAPAAASWAKGRLDVFARGGQNQLVHRSYDRAAGGWTHWQHLGGTLTSAPTAASWGVGRIDVFARVGADRLSHRYFDRAAGGWSGWADLGGTLTSAPGATSWSD